VGSYVEAENDEVVLLVGSSGLFELAVRCESAEERTGLGRGDRFEVVESG
jgi:S-adenosylmethionine hydrolase